MPASSGMTLKTGKLMKSRLRTFQFVERFLHTNCSMHLKTRKHLKRLKKHFHTEHILLFSLVFLFPLHHFSQNKPVELIVWSVGQGQMVTYSDPKSCIHFDMGGEKFPGKKLFEECSRKTNKVFFSHWDWDHINFSRKAWKRLFNLCRIGWPGGKGSKTKKKFLSVIPECLKDEKNIFKEIIFPYHLNKKKSVTIANKNSRIVVVKNRVLIPGDSPGSSERFWRKYITDPISILIVSHHGSRYSTTERLLTRLPYLKLAIASARRKRYGHPHPLVKKRLAKRGVPLLSTEEFHHIRIPLQ